MFRITLALLVISTLSATAFVTLANTSHTAQEAHVLLKNMQSKQEIRRPYHASFDVNVLVEGRRLPEYYARGKIYIEALQGAEYEIQLRNPLPVRVAVALSVDGLNSIDARHTSAWNASKWVIEPYGTITIGGWQMSSERARRFYFTTERDSYAAKLGQTSNIGVISAVFYRERRSYPVTITPPSVSRRSESGGSSSSPKTEAQEREGASKSTVTRMPNEDYAGTGIGRSTRHEVRWIDMELESRPISEISIRYEYYSALRRLGVVPRPYEIDPLRRREQSRGFSPEP